MFASPFADRPENYGAPFFPESKFANRFIFITTRLWRKIAGKRLQFSCFIIKLDRNKQSLSRDFRRRVLIRYIGPLPAKPRWNASFRVKTETRKTRGSAHDEKSILVCLRAKKRPKQLCGFDSNQRM